MDEFKDVAIEFKKAALDWEQYPETAMRAHMTNGRITDADDEVGCINFDYSKFDEFNKKFESTNYFDKNQVPCLTAREAGLYKLVDPIYVMLTDDPNTYLQAVAVSDLYKQYLNEKSEGQTYVDWLERELTNERNQVLINA